MLFAATATATFGMISCNKDASSERMPEKEIVPHAKITLSVGDEGSSTKANIEGDTLKWQLGDQILVSSNGQVNGFLSCTEATDSGTGTFTGDVSQLNPNEVNFFFLANQPAGFSSSVDIDFSTQNGVLSSLIKQYTFVKLMGVKLEQDAEDKNLYKPSASSSPLSFVPFGAKYLTLTFEDLPGSPMMDGEDTLYYVNPTRVSIDGLKNVMRLDLLTGKFTAVAASDTAPTVIAPASADVARSYIMAVLPQTATDMSMTVSFSGADYAQKTWSGIDWTINENFNGEYYTEWAKQTLAELAYTYKYGYAAGSVAGSEQSSGGITKPGYGSGNIDGAKDDSRTTKPGYGGGDIYE